MFAIVKSANHDNISSTLYNNETCEYLKPCQHGFIIVPKSEIDFRCRHIYIIISRCSNNVSLRPNTDEKVNY